MRRLIEWTYNFCRIHSTIRVTPVMGAGVADHVWALEELVGLPEAGNMAGVGVISGAVDKLPTRVQMVLMALGIVVLVYGIAHYGWSFFW